MLTADSTAPVGLLAEAVTIQTGLVDEPQFRIPVTGVVRTKGTTADAAKPAEAILTNADVVSLVAAGLPNEVIIAKVKNAGSVQFDLSTDALVALKNQKVGGVVVAAMIDRASQKETPSGATTTTSPPQPAPPSVPCAGIEMMGLYKVDMRPVSPLIVYQAKVRNATSVTRIVTISWLDLYAQEKQTRGQVKPGDISTFDLGPQQPVERQPINLRIKSCE